MNALKISLIACVCLAALVLTSSARAERQNLPLLSDWKFVRQDAGVAAPTADWQSVEVPHTWNDRDGGAASGRTGTVIQTPDEARATALAAPAKRPVIKTDDPHLKNGYYRGVGWYARSLDIPAEWQGRKRVFLRFEAVSQVAKVYLNGELLGEHRGAFTAFCFELTSKLKFGAANELRVQADNGLQPDVPPLLGDFNVCGGIYRPAELIVTDDVCITPLDRASPGVYLTTRRLTGTEADVEARAVLSNGSGAEAKVSVDFEIADAAGQIVSTAKTESSLVAGATTSATATLRVPNPRLWNGRSDPYLYQATVRIVRGGAVIDTVRQPLGFRTVAITEQDGFVLNGRPYPIHGVNRHQSRQDKGWALSPADHDEDMRLIFDMGATAVRNAHYPQSTYWHDLADRRGLLMWDELPLVDAITLAPEFDANCEQQLREFIAQLYNHPSVAFWGLFNEIGAPFDGKADPLLRQLKSVVQELDASRLIVAASFGRKYHSFDTIPDHTGYNRYPLWYFSSDENTFNTMEDCINSDHAYLGKRTAMIEYGGGGNPAHHQESALQRVAPNSQFHPEEWQTYVHQESWRTLKSNPKVWGSFVWNMFDFASGWRREGGLISLNDKGLVTHDRQLCKDAYFFYQANWNPAPMVRIASRRMTPRRLAETEVQVFCNAREVELKLNGRSLGKVVSDELKVARWSKVMLQPGKNLIEASAPDGSRLLVDSCEWTLDVNARSAAAAAPSTSGRVPSKNSDGGL